MKANEAPEKIYRTTTYLDGDRGKTLWKENPVAGAENIEYIRTDVFLEKAKVDLDKEIKSFTEDLFHKTFGEDKSQDKFWNDIVIVIKHTAKHFFELGLKAKQTSEEIKIGETRIYLTYDGKQWLDLSCTEYEIPSDKFKDGDNVEIIIRKTQKGE